MIMLLIYAVGFALAYVFFLVSLFFSIFRGDYLSALVDIIVIVAIPLFLAHYHQTLRAEARP